MTIGKGCGRNRQTNRQTHRRNAENKGLASLGLLDSPTESNFQFRAVIEVTGVTERRCHGF